MSDLHETLMQLVLTHIRTCNIYGTSDPLELDKFLLPYVLTLPCVHVAATDGTVTILGTRLIFT